MYTLLVGYATICTILCTLFFINLIVKIRREVKSERASATNGESAVWVYIEQVDEQFRLYGTVAGDYISSGTSKEEMWINAGKRYPKQQFLLVSDTTTTNPATEETSYSTDVNEWRLLQEEEYDKK